MLGGNLLYEEEMAKCTSHDPTGDDRPINITSALGYWNSLNCRRYHLTTIFDFDILPLNFPRAPSHKQ